jgi:heme/copper-type cytochrome/quinol oxidase subunit 2
VGFSENQIEADTNLDTTSLSLFSVMMIIVLLITAFMIYYTLYKKRKEKEGDASLIENN